MIVHTFAWDDDNGTGCSVHMTERDRDIAFIQHVTQPGSGDEKKAMEILDDPNGDLWEYLEANCFCSLATYGLDQDKLPDPFTGDELATILHGLRIIQEIRRGENQVYDGCEMAERAAFVDAKLTTCDHFCPATGPLPLTNAEIDALCERINPLDAATPTPNVFIGTEVDWTPPTVEQWQKLQGCLEAEGFTSNLCGGGAAATYLLIELADGRRVTVGCASENWGGQIYLNQEEYENCNEIRDYETDCPNRERNMLKVAEAIYVTACDLCATNNPALFGRCGEKDCPACSAS